jgi:Icc-related predicted phosphoesterase
MRLFFATDIHGSETCFRKFLACHDHYDADVLVLGGDMTGKALVPVVDAGAGRYWTVLQEQRHEFSGEQELARYLRVIRERGLYPLRTSEEELEEFRRDPGRVDRLFEEAMLATVEQWVRLADERLAGKDVRAFVCPGNDDESSIDAILESSERLELAEGLVVDIDGYQLLSTGWSNVTPWQTHREEDEPDLERRLMAMVESATAPPDRLLFNFHCPPANTSLDEAPKISADLVVTGQETAHVGSSAVRQVIERTQPLLSLHGHIHESKGAVRLGKTLAINPGSSYEQGVLHGAVVDLDGKGRVKRYKLTTG